MVPNLVHKGYQVGFALWQPDYRCLYNEVNYRHCGTAAGHPSLGFVPLLLTAAMLDSLLCFIQAEI